MADPALKKMLDNGTFVLAPGVFDMMSTLLAGQVGFSALYASGYWLTASHLGLPDAGLATYSDMVSRVSLVCEHSRAPVIADADTGYGGLLNVQHTVRGYERAGVSAIQIEDQEFPKKCGHTPNRRVVSTQAHCARLKVALDTRSDANLLVIGRTDARTGLGLDVAIERAQAMAECGVDLVFVEALQSEAEMRAVCAAVDAPLLANMADGGQTPILSADALKSIGYAGAIFPATSALAACAAVHKTLVQLKETGTSGGASLYDFNEFCSLVGFEEVWDFERRWADEIQS